MADGTPRDCSSNGCGSQADTAIVRDREIASGEVGPLGRTQGNGPIDAAAMINVFMGNAAASTIGTNSANSGVGVEDDLSAARKNDDKKRSSKMRARQFNLGGLLGGLGGGAGGGAGGLLGGLTGGGGAAAGVKSAGAPESLVASTAGTGAETGLPTANEDGTVDMTFRQVSLNSSLGLGAKRTTLTISQINQDGAGPLEAMIDGTSGGTEMAAFEEAEVVDDVPGFVAGLSLATTTDFPVKVKMPAGMTCDATVGGAENVCVVRLRNNTPAGPFGGAAAFTQTPEARKRALAYRMKMRKARAVGSA